MRMQISTAVAALAVVGTFLGACSEPTPAQEREMQEIAWNRVGQDAIRAKLRDPESAEFSEVRFSEKGGTKVTCGFVNSRNGFGGMGGPQRFVAAGDVLSFLEEEVQDFDEVWNRYC